MNTKSNPWLTLAAVAVVGLAGWYLYSTAAPSGPSIPPLKPAPVKPAPPGPDDDPLPSPSPSPCPGPGPCPLRPSQPMRGASVGAQVGGYKSPDGTETLQIDLPASHHQKNTNGIDGAGLCVFASMRHSGDWQNSKAFYGIFDWMRSKPGGGNPPKVDTMLKAMCAERKLPMPRYYHVTQNDFHVLATACRNRVFPAVSYNYSPTGRYGGQPIAHMVSLVHLTAKWAAILDNNYPGADQIEWMSPQEFYRVYAGNGTGWAILLLETPPPPAPKNLPGDVLFADVPVPVTQAPSPVQPIRVQVWDATPADPGRTFLIVDGKAVGVWCYVEEKWYDRVEDKWSSPTKTVPVGVDIPPLEERFAKWVSEQKADTRPMPLPLKPSIVDWKPLKPTINHGLLERDDRYRDGYFRPGGERTDQGEILAAIESNLVDRTKARRITIIGSEAQRKAVLSEIGSPSWAVVKEFDPADWYPVDVHMVNVGEPVIYIQDYLGHVLHRQINGDRVLSAVERADPNYDPAKDPDLRGPQSKPGPGPSPVPIPDTIAGVETRSCAIGAGGSALLYLILRFVLPLMTASRQPTSDPKLDAILKALEKRNGNP